MSISASHLDVLGPAARDDLAEDWVHAVQGWALALDGNVGREQVEVVVLREQILLRHHLPEHQAKRVHVGLRVSKRFGIFPINYCTFTVMTGSSRSASGDIHRGEPPPLSSPLSIPDHEQEEKTWNERTLGLQQGQAEISNLAIPVGVDEHVGWLQIPVDDLDLHCEHRS